MGAVGWCMSVVRIAVDPGSGQLGNGGMATVIPMSTSSGGILRRLLELLRGPSRGFRSPGPGRQQGPAPTSRPAAPARAYPGEDPQTVKAPEVVAERIVTLLGEQFASPHRIRVNQD